MKIWNFFLILIAAIMVIAVPAGAETVVVLDHLASPAVYDNLGGGNGFSADGQTFVATSDYFAGVRIWIGDPTRPELPSVGSLLGPADLVLFDGTNLPSLIELARHRVVPVGEEISGEVDFFLACPVETNPGQRYYFALVAQDPYGMGLRQPLSSTYPDGSQTFIRDGVPEEHSTGRDVSFRIYGETAFDLDGDGFDECEGDCDDVDPSSFPGAPELPGNLTDENCDGSLGACDPTIVWRNHGQFVRCVSHECEDLVEAGELTEAECDVLVSRAAQSEVGKP